MILVPAVGNAQKLTTGAGAALSKIKYASVRMDFSQTVIKGKAMKDFLAKDASKEVGYWKEFDEDVKEITAENEQENMIFRVPYAVGDTVTISGTAMDGFSGVVQAINLEDGTVDVMISMFGRETAATLQLNQVIRQDD